MKTLLSVFVYTILASVCVAQTHDTFQPIPGVKELTGRLIARSKPSARAKADAIARQYRIRRSTIPDVDVLKVPGNMTERQFAAQLLATGAFVSVTPDFLVFADRTPNDPFVNRQWQHGAIRSYDAWNLQAADQSASSLPIIAICDSGINKNHPDLGNFVLGANTASDLAEIDGGNVADAYGHGTLVAGCAAARGNNGAGVAGVGWNLRLMPVRVTNLTNGTANAIDINEGIVYAANHGAKIINVSWTGLDDPERTSAAQFAKSQGALVVNSAGNDAENWTGDFPDLIVVGSTKSTGARSEWSGSGWGVDCYAPGEAVYSTTWTGGYGYASGTSFSAPIVCGTLALLWAQAPNRTAAQIEQDLYRGCKDLGPLGRDSGYGWGAVDAYRSLLSQPLYDVREFPTFNSYASTLANEINEASQVVGYAYNGVSNSQAAIWEAGVAHPLPKFNPNYGNYWGLGINLLGEAVGVMINYTGTDYSDGRPWYWDGTAMHELPYNGPFPVLQASAINNRREIVGYGRYSPGNAGPYRALYWSSPTAQPVELPLAPGASNSVVSGLDDTGYIYGYCTFGGNYIGCYWTSPTAEPTLLSPLGGYPNAAVAGATFDHSTFVGASTNVGPGWMPTIWQNGSAIALPIPPGYGQSLINDINNQGVLVGLSGPLGGFDQQHRATLWTNAFPDDLNTLVSPSSPGWVLIEATRITNLGQILGRGTYNGGNRSFLATVSANSGQSGLTVNCGVAFATDYYQGDPSLIPLEVEFYRTLTGELVGPFTTYLDTTTGRVPVPTSVRGLFSVRIKPKGWLSLLRNDVVVSDLGTIGAEFLFESNGDIDNDNVISVFDYIYLSDAFDKSSGDPDWNTPDGSGIKPSDCDLDADEVVSVFDYIALSDHFDRAGE